MKTPPKYVPIDHEIVPRGAGGCVGCGRMVPDGERHAVYKYTDNKELGITTRAVELYCGEKCCPVCRAVRERMEVKTTRP